MIDIYKYILKMKRGRSYLLECKKQKGGGIGLQKEKNTKGVVLIWDMHFIHTGWHKNKARIEINLP